jgi:DnaK suppressor protein
MQTYDSSMASHFTNLLNQREAELRAALHAGNAADTEKGTQEAHDVVDFKDMATQQSLATVDQAQVAHAAQEFEQVLAALSRLHDGSYGHCLDCKQAIDLQRLNILPAAALCTACQAVQEQ